MPEEPLQPEIVEELQPLDPDLASAEEELQVSEATVAAEDDATVVVEPAPKPLGQTIAMDFQAHSIIRSGKGPLMVRRTESLKQWIEKCIRTHRGAHPVHPVGYGLTEPVSELIGLSGGQVQIGELSSEVRDALMFHPDVNDVIEFEAILADPDPVTGDASVEMTFQVITGDGSVLPIATALTGEEVS